MNRAEHREMSRPRKVGLILASTGLAITVGFHAFLLSKGFEKPAVPAIPEKSAPKDPVSPAVRAGYTGAGMGEYLQRFQGTRLELADCPKIGTEYDGQIFVGFAVVGNPDYQQPEGDSQKAGNKIHEYPEIESRVVGLLNASQTEASHRVLVMSNYGSRETWVDVSTPEQSGFILASTQIGNNPSTEKVYAPTVGIDNCLKAGMNPSGAIK